MAGIARDDVASALREPRALSEHDVMLISHACNEGLIKRRPKQVVAGLADDVAYVRKLLAE